MTPAKRSTRTLFSVDEYLRAEEAEGERFLYVDGEIFAMAGESGPHADITFNLNGLIHAQLEGSACRGRAKDTKVRSGPPRPRPPRDTTGMYSYPDLVVVCGEPEYYDDAGSILTNPTAIFEVLSPSTAEFDRGEKFTRYQTWNPTLTDYLLVSQDRPQVEHYSRQADGSWRYTLTTGLEAAVTVARIGCTLPLARLYARVEFPSPPTEAEPVSPNA